MKGFINFNKKKVFNYKNILFFTFLTISLFTRLNSQFSFVDIIAQLSFQVIICGILLSFFFILCKNFLFSLICMLVCFLIAIDILVSCVNCNSFLEDKSQKYTKIRFMTFNVGLSNNFNNLREQILLENPDIIQLQEVTLQTRAQLKSLESFFPYNSGLDNSLNPFSSILFSKYPLKNTKIIDYHTVITNVILENGEFTLIGAHVSPPLDDFLGEIYIDMFFTYSNSKRPKKLPEANLGIAIAHIEFIKNLVNKIDKKLIVIGDLNMSPVSKRFNKFLKDTSLYTFISYKNFISTWPTFLPEFFGVQIDHVLFSKHFKVIKIKTNNNKISDHRPLIVDLVLLK